MNTSFFCWRTGSTVKVATVEESKVYYVYPIKRVKAAIYLVWVEGRLDNGCKIRAIFGLMVTMVSVSLSVGLEVLNGDLEPRLPVERVFVGEGARYYLLHTDTHLIFWSRLCVFFLSLFLYNIARRGKENAVGPRDQLAFFFSLARRQNGAACHGGCLLKLAFQDDVSCAPIFVCFINTVTECVAVYSSFGTTEEDVVKWTESDLDKAKTVDKNCGIESWENRRAHSIVVNTFWVGWVSCVDGLLWAWCISYRRR